jgi:hypothetical protein
MADTGFDLARFRVYTATRRLLERHGVGVEQLIDAPPKSGTPLDGELIATLGPHYREVLAQIGAASNHSWAVYEHIRDVLGHALHYLSKTARIQINDPDGFETQLQFLDFFQKSGHEYYRNQGGTMDAIFERAL